MPEGHVYILGSTTGTLYTGVTSKFDQRIFEHRAGIKSIFASKYRCNRLLLHERFTDIRAAIAREKQIKGWTRAKKLELITQTNPDFKDLAAQHGLRTLQPQHYPTNKTVASRACPQIFSYFCLYRNNWPRSSDQTNGGIHNGRRTRNKSSRKCLAAEVGDIRRFT